MTRVAPGRNLRRRLQLLALLTAPALAAAPSAFAASPAAAPVTAAGGAVAAADSRDDVARELAALRAEAAALRAEVAVLRSLATEAALVGRVERVETRLAQLEGALAGFAEEIGAATERAGENEASIALLEDAEALRNHLAVYGSLRYFDEADGSGAFDAEAIELVISGRPHQRLGLFVEIELERAAAVGSERGGEVIVEQAWASYAVSSVLSLRGGVLLVPFGAVNADHYAPTRDTIAKPLPAVAVSPSDWTDNGVAAFGRVVLPGEWVLSYDALLGAGLGASAAGDLGPIGLRAARQPFGEDNNGNRALVARLGLRRGTNLELGLSGYRGAWDDAGQRQLRGWAADVAATLGPLTLRGDVEDLSAARPVGDATFRGWYVRALWRLPPRLLALGWHAQAFPAAALELVAQWDEARVRAPAGDPLFAPLVTAEERRLTLGLNYRPTPRYVIKLNREESTGSGPAIVRGDGDAWVAALGFVF